MGIKRGRLKDSDEHFRKRNKVVDNDVEMYEDRFTNKDIEYDDDSNCYSEQNNPEMTKQSDNEESYSGSQEDIFEYFHIICIA